MLVITLYPIYSDLTEVLGSYRVFADGGSNRVYDILGEDWKESV